MLQSLTFRRTDGTLVGQMNGLPYHIIQSDPLWLVAQAIAANMGDELPFEPAPSAPPAPPLVPAITARQLRLALLGLGLTGAQVEAQIAAMPGTPAQREAAMIEWEYATTYQRDHPLVVMLGAALGLTEAQIDDAWKEAATI
jgi:hypothetical protein